MSWFSATPIASLKIPKSMENLYKSAQKKLTFSSAVNKIIIERRASDIAELSGTTAGSVLEDALINQLLVHDDHARPYVNAVLLGFKYEMPAGTKTPYGIKDALSDIFNEVSAGVDWRPKWDNAKPLVDFAFRLVKEHQPTIERITNPFEINELASELDSVICELERNIDEAKAPDRALQAAMARSNLLALAQHGRFDPKASLHFICMNWDYIAGYSSTFTFLACILNRASPWDDTAQNRSEFQSIAEGVMSEWTRIKRENEKRKQEAAAKKTLTRYPLANGDYVLAPSDWVEINPSCAQFSQFAGTIAIKFGERYNAPNFLFYTDRPINEITEQEREEFISLAETRWPDLAKVKNDLVEIERNPDGGIANFAEVAAAPMIGLFPIYDEGEYPFDGGSPYGEMIVRHNKGAGSEARNI